MEENYYKISLSYEIPYNILDSDDFNVIKARDTLYETLKNSIPDKYQKFWVKLVIHELRDTLNYVVTYDAFFKSPKCLPMQEYVEARDLKDNVKSELEEFFDSVDCDYKQLNIKTLI
jgi:hypothetical protein